MAYLVFNVNGRELGRRQLDDALTIGRAAECDVCIHDILLSRQHCRLERTGSTWTILDLSSKNGTFVGGVGIERHTLAEGQIVRIGKATIRFHSGKLSPKEKSPPIQQPQRKTRPADPWAAMNDTMSGIEYVKTRTEQKSLRLGAKKSVADTLPVGVVARMPTPQPTPKDPEAYVEDDVYSLLTELASSSWDSIYMNASRPLPNRPAPRPIIHGSRHPRHRSATPVDLSLQASSSGVLSTPAPTRRPPRWRRAMVVAARGFATVGQTVMVLGIAHLLNR